MSDDLSKTDLKKKSDKKTITSPAALILVLMVDFIMFAFYPFVFLVIIPNHDYKPYLENYYHYSDEEMIVVLNRDVRISSYLNWETDERSDGKNKLFIPKGSTIEVSRVNMHNYPVEPAYIGISFYYDEEGHGYTLWDDISLDWITHPELITRDLDALREAELKNNRDVRTKTTIGTILAFIGPAIAVLLVFLIFKKNLARHVLFASVLVVIVFCLLFYLGPIGSNLYYYPQFYR